MTSLLTTHTIDEPCPHCGRRQDSLSHPTRRPHEGDVAVCAYCAGITILDDELRRRLPTPAELEEVLADPGVIWMVFGIRKHLFLNEDHE